MDEFVHAYEMESLQLGVMARRDITNQLRALFPEGTGDALEGFLATTKALAARHAGADEAKEEDHKPRTCRLRVAGNDKDNFHRRLRNIHVLALTNAVLNCRLTGIEALEWPFNRLGEEAGEDDVPSFDQDGKAEFVDENKYRLDAAPCLARLLQSTAVYSSIIREVDLRGNYLGGESCRLLCSALIEAGTECSLQRLLLRGNPLGLAGGHALAELLQSPNCTIEELDLGDARLEVANLISISTALRENTTLRSLNLDNPVIQTKEEEAIQHIGKMLQVNGTLEELSLGKHQLTDHGAQVLAERLLSNDTLRILSLRANRIGSDGAEALAALSLRHPTLSSLDLSANRLTDAGGRAFARALSPAEGSETFCSLRVLALCSTSMTDAGVAAVVAACVEQRRFNAPEALQALLLWGNSFGDASALLLTELAAMTNDENPINMDVITWTPTGEQDVRVAHRELPATSIGAPFASCKQ